MSQKNCMTKKEQIEKMAKLMCDDCARSGSQCELNKNGGMCDAVIQQAECIYNAGYRKQTEGEWVRYPHGSGIYCSECRHKRRYRDIHDAYCPNCGARMKVGA